MRTVALPDAEHLEAAAEVVGRTLRPTPVVPSPLLGPGVWLKLETLQPTGSFKVRGGLAAVAAAQRRQPGTPLVAASAGNHGLGVAYAADRLGADATVVVPRHASEAKVRALAAYDVELVRDGDGYDEAERSAMAIAEANGGRFVSPYNDPDVIAGQATVATELLAQLPDLTTVVVPVGGGGLVSGIALATEGTGVRIVGVEPDVNRTMSAAIAAGEAVPVAVGETIADGLAGNLEPGSVTVAIVVRHGVTMVSVSEEQIRTAIRFLAVEHGLVAEGAGAAATAAVFSGRFRAAAGTIAVLVTGRNIDPVLLSSMLAG
ncbi:MAG: threonine ammonia-lyase [Acidimicrobiales bacterium]